MKKRFDCTVGFVSTLFMCLIIRSAFGASIVPASLVVENFVAVSHDFNDAKIWRRERASDKTLTQRISTSLGMRDVPYCRLLTYRLIRNARVAGIAVVPAWHDDSNPVHKMWGRQGGGNKYHMLRLDEPDGAWTKPFAGVDMLLTPKIWHREQFGVLAGFGIQVYDTKSLRIMASQFYADPSFVKQLPRPPQPTVPLSVIREQRRG